MDQARKKQIKKYAIMTIMMLIMALAVGKLNQVNKTQLINRTGQTFETGKVVRILEDNIQEDGMRVGPVSYTHLTSQIIIDHVKSRDDVTIDKMCIRDSGSSDRAEREYGASDFAESLCTGEWSRKYVWQCQRHCK